MVGIPLAMAASGCAWRIRGGQRCARGDEAVEAAR
jgi:hypothetical protein